MSATFQAKIASVASHAECLDLVEEADTFHSDGLLNVFLTVDTEVCPITSTWRNDRLLHDVDRDIYGRVATGEYGLNYQLEVLRRYDLKASFFVDPLFALSPDVGEVPLRRIIHEIQDAGQEVQMHLHPEWVPELAAPIAAMLTERKSDVLNRFNAADQATLIRVGLETLRRCGAQNVRAFRAGDYAADFHTLRALHDVGIEFDTSYNYCYLKSMCGLGTLRPVVQAIRMGGVWEIPICFFRDWPGHSRHTQLGACSSGEITRALESANRAGWWSFVIVSHSFECIKNRRSVRLPSVRPHVVARFEHLCAYLDGHRDRFRTAHFGAIDSKQIPPRVGGVPLRGRLTDTLGRLTDTMRRRVKGHL